MTNSKESAYTEASKIDDILNKLLEEFPITEENVEVWSLFLRTIRTSILIIDSEVEKRLLRRKYFIK